jgi:hypothetical protein
MGYEHDDLDAPITIGDDGSVQAVVDVPWEAGIFGKVQVTVHDGAGVAQSNTVTTAIAVRDTSSPYA